MDWEKGAETIDAIYDTYVDWNERFFVCPECMEPIYWCDYPKLKHKYSADTDIHSFVCPVCEEEIEIC